MIQERKNLAYQKRDTIANKSKLILELLILDAWTKHVSRAAATHQEILCNQAINR